MNLLRALFVCGFLTTQSFAQTQPQTGLDIQSAVSSAGGQSAVEMILTEEMIAGLRDPFQIPSIILAKKDAPKTDLEMVELKDFKLNGIITGPKKTKAMITLPNGKAYFVAVGDRIGSRDGHITAIQSDSVKVVEYEIDEKGKRIPEVYAIRINGELESLSKKEE